MTEQLPEEEVMAHARQVFMAAARVGEEMARRRQFGLRGREADQRQQRLEDRGRVNAQRASDIAGLSLVHQPDWWTKAEPLQIARSWAVATQWAAIDPAARAAEQKIEEEVKARYGLDLPQLRRDATTNTAGNAEKLAGDQLTLLAADARDLARDAQQLADDARNQAADDQARDTDAAVKPDQQLDRPEQLDEADDETDLARPQPDGSPREAGNVGRSEDDAPVVKAAQDIANGAYDTAGRRDALAEQLRGMGASEETIQARVAADLDQAKPATEAVHGKPGRQSKARKATSPSRTKNRPLER